MAISARRFRIIDPGRFVTGGPPAERRGVRGEVTPAEKIWDIVAVLMQEQSSSTVSLLLTKQYPAGVLAFCKYQRSAVVSLILAYF